jgi:hypothetical protein
MSGFAFGISASHHAVGVRTPFSALQRAIKAALTGFVLVISDGLGWEREPEPLSRLCCAAFFHIGVCFSSCSIYVPGPQNKQTDLMSHVFLVRCHNILRK